MARWWRWLSVSIVVAAMSGAVWGQAWRGTSSYSQASDSSAGEEPSATALDLLADEPELCRVAREGTPAELRKLLERGGGLEVRGLHGRTPLMIAAAGGRLEVLELLLAAGADVGARDDSGNTALFFPPPSDDPAIAERLLAYGARIEARNKAGYGPLWGTALVGHRAVVELLLEQSRQSGASLDPGDLAKALAVAVERGHLATAEVFVRAGVGVDEPRIRARGSGEATLLFAMAERGASETVAFLLAHGAEVDRVPPCCEGETPLLAASRRGHAAVVDRLVAAGAVLATTDAEGWTPLLAASHAGHVEAVRSLLVAGAETEDRGHHETENTPLLWAAMEGHHHVARLLLANGADPDAANRSRVTPLMHAAFRDDLELAQLLIEHGAELEASHRDGRTPLLFAVFRRHERVTAFLLEHGARTDVLSRIEGFGRVSPLMLAAGRGELETARLLLAHGAEPDAPCSVVGLGQATPLMMAARRGHLDMVEALLAFGADPAWQRRDGATALDWARETGREAVVALLETKVAAP